MLTKIKDVLFGTSNKDLRKRFVYTLACLAIFALGTNITVPGAKEITRELGFLDLLDLMAGGGLRNFSIFALGVSPYITASIITQLLQMDIVPYFSELKHEGYTGRQKINKINRYVGILFGFLQGYFFSIAFLGSSNPLEILKTALILTAGTAFLLWLGDQITSKGIGNGISLIIMAGIIQSMPNTFITAFHSLITNGTNQALGTLLFSVFVLVYIIIIIGIIYISEAERRIPIQYSNRTTSAYGAQQTFLPIKINAAGVIPVIFASTLLAIPTTIAEFVGKEGFKNFVSSYLNYTTPVGFVLYVVLIMFFAYFYTFLQMNPDEMSKNLNDNGGYIPGVRPGEDTSSFIRNVLSKTNIFGSLFLVALAAAPILFSLFSKLPSTVTIGGTGLLIVVGVALETYKQMSSSMVARSYKRRPRRI